jgi:predicted transcriptional regulator
MDAQAEFPTILKFFKALANESRLRLLGLIGQREHNVQELASRLSLSEPTISHHLSLLKRLGLVAMRADGTTHWYALDADALGRLAKSVLTRDQVVTLAPATRPHPPSTLNNFVTPEGMLLQIPASRKKRLVILAWLVEQFETDRIYSEAEVNRILKRHHEDCATLRRELVGYRMMVREDGRYRRLPQTEWKGE